jgi:WS/DGAT/MGAT family acyltransferase
VAPERLNALDASFLYLERPRMHMHVAALTVLDPSTRPDRRLRFAEFRRLVHARLHLAPRFRERVLEVPGNLARPVWADDDRFDLDYHLRHAALPGPGDRAELADLVGRLLSRPLDRSRPLWETVFIEGLEGGHIAVLHKVHHALVDGIAGIHVLSGMLDTAPDAPIGEAQPWRPEPTPSPQQLAAQAIRDQLTDPVEAAVHAIETFVKAPLRLGMEVAAAVTGVSGLLGMGATPEGPFDHPVGPARRFAMTEAPVQRFKDVKNALGGTVNDVVLTVVAGAVYRMLRARGDRTCGRSIRALVPVSVRTQDQHGVIGNRVAPAFVDLPIGRMGAKRRLAEVRGATGHLKGSMMAVGADAIINLGTWAPPALHSSAARLISHGRWFNLVVSNIPAPQQPLYLAGARVLANYPAMPIGENAALSVACTSLCGTMAFGLTADWDAVPDLDALADAIDDSLTELAKAAGA